MNPRLSPRDIIRIAMTMVVLGGTTVLVVGLLMVLGVISKGGSNSQEVSQVTNIEPGLYGLVEEATDMWLRLYQDGRVVEGHLVTRNYEFARQLVTWEKYSKEGPILGLNGGSHYRHDRLRRGRFKLARNNIKIIVDDWIEWIEVSQGERRWLIHEPGERYEYVGVIAKGGLVMSCDEYGITDKFFKFYLD